MKKLDYESIDSYVKQYKEGNEEAGAQLLMCFGYHHNTKKVTAFYKKWLLFLRYGGLNLKKKDIRKFLMLLIKKNYREELIPFYQYHVVQKECRKVTQTINHKLQYHTDEEVIQDISLCILTLAKRYQKQGKKINFCGYLYNAFPYLLFEQYKKYFQDVLSIQRDEIEDVLDEKEVNEAKEEWLHKDIYFLKEEDGLNLNWILGKTCSPSFEALSPLEREILILNDMNKYTLEEIGLMKGYHRDTIYRKRKKALAKIT